MASCVSPPPRYLAFLPVHMLYWRPSSFWRREQRDEEATGEVKELKNRKTIYHLIQRKTRRSIVASRKAMVDTATIAGCDDDDDDDDVTETSSVDFKY